MLDMFDATRHLPTIEARFPDVMDLYLKVGIHPTLPCYCVDVRTGMTIARNLKQIGHHQIAVWHLAAGLGVELLDRNLIDSDQLEAIEREALLHDIRKPYDLLWGTGSSEQRLLEVELPSLLSSQGFKSAEVKTVMNSGKWCGHTGVLPFLVRPTSIGWGENILFLADAVTSTGLTERNGGVTTEFLTPNERAERSQFRFRYPWLYTSGLALDPAGEIVEVEHLANIEPNTIVLGSWYELQIQTAERCAKRLGVALGIGDTSCAELMAHLSGSAELFVAA